MGNDKQPHDFTEGKNSWKLELDEVPFEEFMEVQSSMLGLLFI